MFSLYDRSGIEAGWNWSSHCITSHDKRTEKQCDILNSGDNFINGSYYFKVTFNLNTNLECSIMTLMSK